MSDNIKFKIDDNKVALETSLKWLLNNMHNSGINRFKNISSSHAVVLSSKKKTTASHNFSGWNCCKRKQMVSSDLGYEILQMLVSFNSLDRFHIKFVYTLPN